jgi:hypothetical protein
MADLGDLSLGHAAADKTDCVEHHGGACILSYIDGMQKFAGQIVEPRRVLLDRTPSPLESSGLACRGRPVWICLPESMSQRNPQIGEDRR